MNAAELERIADASRRVLEDRGYLRIAKPPVDMTEQEDMTYATVEELATYLEPNEAAYPIPEGDDAEALIERAERDVDLILGRLPQKPVSGLKLNPADLTQAQRAALSRATCAAAEWRLLMSEEALVGDEDGIGSVGGLSFTAGALPRPPGPKVIEELTGFGFPVRSGTVSADF